MKGKLKINKMYQKFRRGVPENFGEVYQKISERCTRNFGEVYQKFRRGVPREGTKKLIFIRDFELSK